MTHSFSARFSLSLSPAAVLFLCALAAAGSASAQTPAASGTTLDPVVISVERTRQTSFDAPAAITAIGREVIEGGGLQVNLSEALNRVPGITVLNRQNYAQDLQLSIRGFGSRSTFGIRGVRLLVDGIPASMPDGQGQASNVALSSAGRIEVLRGPMAQLYGNAAGGVVQVFSDVTGGLEGDGTAIVSTLGRGSFDQTKLSTRLHHVAGGTALMVDGSYFSTDGSREHSSAKRQQINGVIQHDFTPSTRVNMVFNSLDQPDSKDPLGLTRAQFEANPQQAVALAKQQNASKTVTQNQLGLVLEHGLSERTQLTARWYGGDRLLNNRLSIPPAAQTAATSAGGIVEFDRTYTGVGLNLSHRVPMGAGRSLRGTVGLEYDRQSEDRQGYLNTNGVRGALKRDELNTIRSTDAFVQGAFDVTPDVAVTAGARNSRVEFSSQDRFIIAGNPDDSGQVSYSATNPVLGVSWRVMPVLNVYANVGRGFETPTFTELAYRANATGLNTGLRASRSRHAELGAKFKLGQQHRVDAALFDIQTENDIVVDTNVGGRSTFRNAGQTSRRGVELSHVANWGWGIATTLSATVMQARFEEAFVSGSGATAVPVRAGARLPGTPEKYGFAELIWKPAGVWGGFNAAAEVVATGGISVNDSNTDAAASSVVLNLRAGFQQNWGNWQLKQGLRVDNVSDRRYAGSVIVNDGNARFFEPALPRNWSLAATARYAWK